MPRANRSWVEVDPTENWTSVTDPKVRRRLQNRINARAHRRRKAIQREEEKLELRQQQQQLHHHISHPPTTSAQLLPPDFYPLRTESMSPSPSITSVSPSPSPLLGMAQVAHEDQSASWCSSSSVASGPVLPVYPSEIEMPSQQRRYTQPHIPYDNQAPIDLGLTYTSPPPTINLPIGECCSPPPMQPVRAPTPAPDALFSWDINPAPWMAPELDVAYAVAAASGFSQPPQQPQQVSIMESHNQHHHQQQHHVSSPPHPQYPHRNSLDVFPDGSLGGRNSPSPVPMVPRYSLGHGVFPSQNIPMIMAHDMGGSWVR